MSADFNPVNYYDDNAETFTKLTSNRDTNWFEYEKNMPSLLRMSKGINGEVLDFGCGPGNFTSMFIRKNRTVEGCDPSTNLLLVARKAHPNIEFFSCEINGDVATNKKYDLIVAKLVFHYITDIETVLQNLSQRLSNSGGLLISVPHPNKTRVHFKLPPNSGLYIDEIGQSGLSPTMIHRSVDQLKRLFAANNLRVESIVDVYHYDKPKRLNILLKKRRV